MLINIHLLSMLHRRLLWYTLVVYVAQAAFMIHTCCLCCTSGLYDTHLLSMLHKRPLWYTLVVYVAQAAFMIHTCCLCCTSGLYVLLGIISFPMVMLIFLHPLGMEERSASQPKQNMEKESIFLATLWCHVHGPSLIHKWHKFLLLLTFLPI